MHHEIKRFSKRISLILMTVLLAATNCGLVFADDPAATCNQQPQFDMSYYVSNNVTMLDDPCRADCSSNASNAIGTAPKGSGSKEIAFRFFVSKGLTASQAAGIIGNLVQESNIDPKAPNPGAPGGGGGIAQWERDRWSGSSGLLAFAAGTKDFAGGKGKQLGGGGGNWQDLLTQLNFMWGELTQVFPSNRQPGLAQLRAAPNNNPEAAAEAFELAYERAGDPNMPRRRSEARSAYSEALKNGWDKVAPGTTTTTTSSGAPICGTSGATNVSGTFIIYNQFDPRWANKPYGSSTVGVAGCGPSAMAMIVTALTGQQITPDIVAAYGAAHGTFEGGQSQWNIAPVIAAHYGLKATKINLSVNDVNKALSSGAYVFTAGHDTLPYTTDGHMIVIRQLLPNGKWKIGDSGHTNTNNQEWDPAAIITNGQSGATYAVSK